MTRREEVYTFGRNEQLTLLILCFLCAWAIVRAHSSFGGLLTLSCPSWTLFHIPCPGCGLTRAFTALAQGQIGEALGQNPLILFILPTIGHRLLTIAYGCSSGMRLPALPRMLTGSFQWGFVLLWFLLLIVRLGTTAFPAWNPNQILMPF